PLSVVNPMNIDFASLTSLVLLLKDISKPNTCFSALSFSSSSFSISDSRICALSIIKLILFASASDRQSYRFFISCMILWYVNIVCVLRRGFVVRASCLYCFVMVCDAFNIAFVFAPLPCLALHIVGGVYCELFY